MWSNRSRDTFNARINTPLEIFLVTTGNPPMKNDKHARKLNNQELTETYFLFDSWLTISDIRCPFEGVNILITS